MNSRLFAIPLWPACSSSPPAVAKEERMGWNNFIETNSFYRNEEEFIRLCREQGMSEESIQKMCKFDQEMFNSDRRFYEHTQPLYLDEQKIQDEEGKSPYYAYYFDSFSTEQTPNEERDYWWLDEIENDSLYKAIMKLTPKRRKLVQLLVFDGYSQVDAAEKLGISQGTVWNQWEKIVNLLKETVNV